jgi:hypothetical protein
MYFASTHAGIHKMPFILKRFLFQNHIVFAVLKIPKCNIHKIILIFSNTLAVGRSHG